MQEPDTGRQRPAGAASALAMAQRAACLVIVASGAAWIVWRALAHAIDLPTIHLDGAFQTASGLHRLKDGQWPGRDFFPYLGVGPLLALLPLFLAGGGDLAASVMASVVLTQGLGVFGVALLWHLVFRPRRVLDSAAAGVLLFVGPQAVLAAWVDAPTSFSWPIWFDVALWPRNSLRPVRAALPGLVAAAFWAVHGWCGPQRERLRSALWGLLAGACVLWSNDYAFTTAALLCGLVAVVAWQGDGPRLARVWPFALAALLTAAGALLLATRGHALALLHYNLVDVAGDQWWLFMPYEPEARVFGWADAGKLLDQQTRGPLVVLAAVLAWALLRRSLRAGLLAFVGLSLFAGGAAASIGGHLADYFGAFAFWAWMLVLIVGLRVLAWCGQRLLRHGHGPVRGAAPVGVAAVLGLAAGSVGLAAGAAQRQRDEVARAAHDPSRFFVPELGGYLGEAWREPVAQARLRPDAVLVEEYWGLWSALRGGRSGWPVDAAIHALGSTRARAAAALARADIVTSTRRNYSLEWQAWSLSHNHWFYRELLAHWTPERLTPSTIVWRRRAAAAPPSHPVACEVHEGDAPSLRLPQAVAGLHELTLRYRLAEPSRALVLVRNPLSRVTGGWASIDPRGSSAQLPLEVPAGGEWTVPLRVLGRPGSALKLLGCEARRLPTLHEEVWQPSGESQARASP